MSLAVVATGGTIASLPDPESGAVRPVIGADELLRTVDGLEALGPLEVVEVDRVNGWNVTPETMLRVAAEAAARLAAGADGVVVTHGTDTMEETAFVCELLVGAEAPVVFTGAMRTGAEVAADGPRNLLGAARVATAAPARGWGAVIVMNDEVHSARWCTKTDSYRTSAFSSPGRGAVGGVTPERLRIDTPGPRVVLPVPDRLPFDVAIVKAYTGMDERLIDSVLATTGARGLVVEGTGAGNVPGSAMPGIRAATSADLPVVIATRVATGGVVPIYGGPGGGVTLRAEGVLGAGSLTAAKARLLLMVALATTATPEEARSVFASTVAALAPGAIAAS